MEWIHRNNYPHLGAAALVWRYPITEEHAEIRADLDASKAAERAAGRPVGVATA